MLRSTTCYDVQAGDKRLIGMHGGEHTLRGLQILGKFPGRSSGPTGDQGLAKRRKFKELLLCAQQKKLWHHDFYDRPHSRIYTLCNHYRRTYQIRHPSH